jgi:hypothetical protein
MIPEIRTALAKACEPCAWDVWNWEPMDANTVPCVVVGRPTLQAAPRPLYAFVVPVWTIGRRYLDADSDAELDAVTDHVIELLNHVCTVAAIAPEYRTVADITHPAYRIDCAVGDGIC